MYPLTIKSYPFIAAHCKIDKGMNAILTVRGTNL